MSKSKIIQFIEADIRAYNQLVDPTLGSKISLSYLATLWQEFDLLELADQTPILMKQAFSCCRELSFHQTYAISLSLTDQTPFKPGKACWTYTLAIKEENAVIAACATTLLVEEPI
ncbi:hypothetical protein [Trichococcus collinsii]|uniref:Uncharacterized protein n=1 Tax=Trichococcus collinsii TaxID=157076 RepID=A0AB38A2M5_9LACT|nr:hypothetical protein [Trichococcus collinsii]CZQ98446.1 Hypothetical protein Tcol_1627 [Trichococcus collinsii]SEA80552.1 hypothetical protein SAMN04488525_10667 [Trichococcus collinsii]